VISLALLCCNTKSKEKENITWKEISVNPKVENLINFLFEFPQTERRYLIYGQLDSLLKIDSKVSLVNTIIKPYSNRESCLIFLDTGDDAGDYYLRKRNTYLLTIGEKGLFHKNRQIELTEFSNELKKKFYEWENGINVTQRKTTEVKYFGFVLVSKVITVLDIEENMNKIDWDRYILTICQVHEVYRELWNEKSLEIWDVEFDKLKLDKQEALIDLYPFRMELNFNKRTFRIK